MPLKTCTILPSKTAFKFTVWKEMLLKNSIIEALQIKNDIL